MTFRRIAVLPAVLLPLTLGVGCGDESTAGGYDKQGYPRDASGQVSSNPEDYHESVCERVGDMASDYESEC